VRRGRGQLQQRLSGRASHSLEPNLKREREREKKWRPGTKRRGIKIGNLEGHLYSRTLRLRG
jgi:hypothetical protein